MTMPLDADTSRHRDNPRAGFIAVIAGLAQAAGPKGLTLREIRDRLDERGFGLLILILSVPCLVPALYGVPQIIGVPILLLAAQLLIGRREPWLPRVLLDRRVPNTWLDRMGEFATRRMGWFERLSRPRLAVFANGLGERVAAGFMILATLTIVLPMTNTVPSIALALMAAGLIVRDGLFVLGGMAVAVGWATALAVAGAGLVFGAGWAAGLMGWLG